MNDSAEPSPAGGLARWIPGLALFRQYQRQWLAGDLLAGISVCLVTIPSAIAYARLMGLPQQNGLYATLVPLVVYPLFASSRQVIVGPVIAISLLMASAIVPLAGGDPARAAGLAALMAILSGILLLLGARARLGAMAEFLSKPVLIGYMTGAALILMASQLNGLMGVPLERTDFFPRLIEAAGKWRQVNLPTFVMGLSLLAGIFVLRRLAPRVPIALVVCAAAILLSWLLGLEARGIAVAGKIPGGLPAPKVPPMEWRDLQSLFPAALGIALLTYTEGILLARALAARGGYEVRPNQELAALGAAALTTGFFQGFAVTGSQSRTTVNVSAGGKTQLSSLIAAVTLALFLLFLTPVLARLPIVALAAILIYGGFTLVEFDAMKRIYRYYPRAAILAAATTLAVLAAGVVPGILFGVVLSLLGLVARVSHPADAVLREVPGHGFHDVGNSFATTSIPGLLVFRYYAPLLFCNCGHFAERVRTLIAASAPPVRWFLLDAQAITDIDVTAAEMLHALHAELQGRGIALKIAHANPPFRELLERTGLFSELSTASFFPSVHDCVDAFQASGGKTG
jgi:SulP family sulfate permease